MKQESSAGISFFQKYLTAWVFLRMVAGILLGHFAPAFPELLARFEYARISIPMAILIWVTICPMMLKVDFQSIRNVGNSPKRTVCDLDCQLAHQALYDVWYCQPILLCVV